MFGLFKKKKVVEVTREANLADTDLLYAQTGQGRYRIFRNTRGKYVAQLKVSDTAGGRYYPDTNEYWEDVQVLEAVLGMWVSEWLTEKEAEEAAVKHANERKKAWKLRKSAGPVRELGKLP